MEKTIVGVVGNDYRSTIFYSDGSADTVSRVFGAKSEYLLRTPIEVVAEMKEEDKPKEAGKTVEEVLDEPIEVAEPVDGKTSDEPVVDAKPLNEEPAEIPADATPVVPNTATAPEEV